MTHTRPDEFRRFHGLLMASAPPGYIPHYFKAEHEGKDPIKGVSWKTARINYIEAIEWLREDGNVGLAGTPYDPLVIVDDDTGKMDMKPTLKDKSRRRKGGHGFYWCFEEKKILNIKTEKDGEVRSYWQYVIVPGSYVPADPEGVPEWDLPNLGCYTLEVAVPPTTITFEELPRCFIEQYEYDHRPNPNPPRKPFIKPTTGHMSQLFEVEAREIAIQNGIDTDPRKRSPSPFHPSPQTHADTSLSAKGLIVDWANSLTFNGLQALVSLSGYMSYRDAGSPFHGSGGASRVNGDDGAIFHAWLYAKQHNYIPEDDPLPTRAMHYIAQKHLGYVTKEGEILPRDIYRQVLQIVEAEY